ncbi:Flagellar assembly protein FliH [Pseudomonas sp. 8AS]|uniref:flagellar assembly protein FliH n=1 Tax=Pseudomonas sp. 8AS TaxID=2653163 RepID=UPI0012EF73BA|nr:flagellar assembly protein FliH [Pseudomonas sp. 8AS]VXC27709.1 Flagellar assembly protein FliH [Pseudomonas sp. 8AS]
MDKKIIKGGDRNWRPYHFPPRCREPRGEVWDGDPVSRQRAIADGFQQGMDKGYQEGLQQGRSAGREGGFAEGREEGLRLGREEGRQQGREAFDRVSQPIDGMLDELRRFRTELEDKRRQELLELVSKVAKQVIRCELTLNPTQLLSLAEEALASMPGDPGEVQVLLNPEEYQRLRDLAPERAAQWRLLPDERLGLGECRVVTAQAEADIGCQQRLDSCMDALADHLKLPQD